MKNILVPTDFSKVSSHALDLALKLAKPLKANVIVLHLEPVPLGDTSLSLMGDAGGGPSISGDSLYNAQLFRANKQKLNAIEQQYGSDEVNVTGVQHGGGFLKGIQHFLEKSETDLVVIGTTGEESIQEFFSGNHTEQLIEHLNVPVISVQDRQYHEIEDIVLGLDLQDEHYTQKAFEMVKIISEALNARLHIINITNKESTEELMSQLNKIAQIVGLSNYVVDVVEDKEESVALMEYAEGTDAGLIVALSEAKSGLYRFFQHSFATRLTKYSGIPVLTINKAHLA